MNKHPYNPKFKHGYAVLEIDMFGGTRVIKVYNTQYRAEEYKESLESTSGKQFCVLQTMVEINE